MRSLVRSAPLDSVDPVHALLALTEPEALGAAMNALDPEEAVLAISRAPSIDDRSRLVWALEPERRREVLDALHPGFVGALIQNREKENRQLLACLSREQFTRLLRYCSPERVYYWLTLATSFKDPRANMLPLLIPIDELAAALLTRPEFENHCQQIGDFDVADLSMDQDYFQEIASATVTVRGAGGSLEEFSIRDPRLRDLLQELEYDPEGRDAVVEIEGAEGTLHALPLGDPRLRRLMDSVLNRDPEQFTAIMNAFGPEALFREFRVRDPRLRRLLETILNHDPEHYAALVQAALRLLDYETNHPEEREVVHEDPIMLDSLLTLDEERSRAGLEVATRPSERPKAADIRSVPSLPARQSAELMRSAAGMLPVERQSELSQEMQLLFMQEAAYAGGSFLEADLDEAAGRVQSYIQLGLTGLSEGDAAQAAKLLGEQRLRTLMESGARQVERLRQVALRLLPWHEVLDKGQLRLLQSLEHPKLAVEGEPGRPVLRLRPVRGRADEPVELEAAREELEQIHAWITLVRAVGKTRIARRMGDTSTAALARSLIIAAVMYRHWDPALVEAADVQRFRESYLDPATGRFTQPVYHALAESIRTLAGERKLEPAAVQEIARLLARALEELATGGGDG